MRTARESGLNSLANEQLERTKEKPSSVRTGMRKGITMEAIKTVGLSKLYGKKRAVDNLSFTIGSGEIYGFVGRNGAGKSTVMKMLAGLILPSSGEIEILGEKWLQDAQAVDLVRLSKIRGFIQDYRDLTM